MLAMRGIGGRGAIAGSGQGRQEGAASKGTPGINTPMSFQDYERIMGKEKVDDERQVAARKMSARRAAGSASSRRSRARSRTSSPTFAPATRPRSRRARIRSRSTSRACTAASTSCGASASSRTLDDKAADYPLNNPDLWTNLEVSVNADGTVHKVTIAKTSGKTEFDVAAIDTVLSSAPFEATPEAIRSVDGRIYLRWGFYRNWRQCGTFNVEPYILTEVADDGGQGTLDDGAMVRNTAKLPGKKRAPVGDKPVTPDDGRAKQRVSPGDVGHRQAGAVRREPVGVARSRPRQVDKLVKYSTVPFYAGGKVAAQTQARPQGHVHRARRRVRSDEGLEAADAERVRQRRQALPDGNLVLQVRTAKESFAVVLTRTKSGDYRATQLAR